MDTVTINIKNVPVVDNFDVAVAGGGAAGFAAAVSAARLGSKVALIESEGMLGGNATVGGVSTVSGLHIIDAEAKMHRIVGGVAAEISNRLRESGKAIGPMAFKGSSAITFDPWAFLRLIDEMAMAEKNLRLFLHARVIDVIRENEKLGGLIIHQVGGLRAVRAPVLIDCTGDAELSRLAGAETRRADRIMYPSLMFRMANTNHQTVSIADLFLLAKLLDEYWEDPAYKLPRRGGNLIPTARPHETLVAATRITTGGRDAPAVDASDPDQLTLAVLEGRRQIDEVTRFIRDKMPGFNEAYVSCVSPRIGVRETNTVVGEYTLTENDVLNANHFPDAIAANCWPIEDHVPGGLTQWRECPTGQFYQVPYRCLVPKNVDNLLVAGRCMSATHEALASARTIALCMATGQAAGTAAHIAAREKVSPRKIPMQNLRKILDDAGAIIER